MPMPVTPSVDLWLDGWAAPNPKTREHLRQRTGCDISVARWPKQEPAAGAASVNVLLTVSEGSPSLERSAKTTSIWSESGFDVVVVRRQRFPHGVPGLRYPLTDRTDVIEIGRRAEGWTELERWLNRRFGPPPGSLAVLTARIEAAYHSIYILTEALRQRDGELTRLAAEVDQLEALNAALLAELRKETGPSPKTAKGSGRVLKAGLGGLLALCGLAQGVEAAASLYDRAAENAPATQQIDIGGAIVELATKALNDLELLEATPAP